VAKIALVTARDVGTVAPERNSRGD